MERNYSEFAHNNTSVYLQFVYDFRFSDGHQVSILDSKGGKGNDGEKTGVNLL